MNVYQRYFVVHKDGGFLLLHLFLAYSRLHCLFQVVLHYTSDSKFAINQLHIRIYYKVRQAPLQRGTIFITK